jgi:hypothetical protein
VNNAVSNILALPLVSMIVETGNNEDWIESIKYIVGPENIPNVPQVDLRGIRFEMEVRRSASDVEVVLRASTENGMITIGAQPDVGYLLWRIPLEDMKEVAVGNYVADILAKEDFRSIERVTVQIALTIREGVTK